MSSEITEAAWMTTVGSARAFYLRLHGPEVFPRLSVPALWLCRLCSSQATDNEICVKTVEDPDVAPGQSELSTEYLELKAAI